MTSEIKDPGVLELLTQQCETDDTYMEARFHMIMPGVIAYGERGPPAKFGSPRGTHASQMSVSPASSPHAQGSSQDAHHMKNNERRCLDDTWMVIVMLPILLQSGAILLFLNH